MGNDGDVDVVLVTQLPPDSWFEGFAVRPNNHLVAARLDAPSIYDLDAENPDAEPQPLCELPGAASAINLVAVPGRQDEYSIITSDICDLAACRWQDFAVWHLKINPDGKAEATKKGEIKDIALPLGLCAVNEQYILVADSVKLCIQVLDVTTGQSEVLLADEESMKPKGEDAFFGINRICLAGGYLWYSNYGAGSIHRVPYELDGSNPRVPLKVTGPVELVADDLKHCDGFQVTPGGSAAYTLNSVDGNLMKTDVKSLQGAKAQSVNVQERLVSPTCLELGTPGKGKQKIFVMCCGEIDVGWLDASDKLSWTEWSKIQVSSTVEVTVTTE
ncbi:hypothetical protein JX266_005896 [Neoarthrinium moseri]|nr:hypothetical protein JX266_005896 [Neoarthrinium moseri]